MAHRVTAFDPIQRRRDCLVYSSQIDGEGAWVLVAYGGRYGGAERLWIEADMEARLPWH